MYDPLPAGMPITQGDIIDGCPIFSLEDPAAGRFGVQPKQWLVRAIVLTQSCDLISSQKGLTRVVVAQIHKAIELVDRGELKTSTIRDQVRRGMMYGWYFLPAAPAPIALPESIIDLRDIHTVERAVLDKLVADGKEVCRFVTPYREDLAQHFAVTYSRIGLPEPYETQ